MFAACATDRTRFAATRDTGSWENIVELAFSADGQLVFVLSIDRSSPRSTGVVYAVRAADGVTVTSSPRIPHLWAFQQKTEQELLLFDESGVVTTWNIATRAVTAYRKWPENEPNHSGLSVIPDIRLSSDGALLIGTEARNKRIGPGIETFEGRVVFRDATSLKVAGATAWGDNRGFEVAPRGALLASLERGRIHLWAVPSGDLRRTLTTEDWTIEKRGYTWAKFSRDGHKLAAGGRGVTEIWNVDTGRKDFSFRSFHDARIAWSSQYIVASAWDRAGCAQFEPSQCDDIAGSQEPVGRIFIWDVSMSKIRAVLGRYADAPIKLDFAPDGERLAAASYNGDLRLWDVRSGREVWRRQGGQ